MHRSLLAHRLAPLIVGLLSVSLFLLIWEIAGSTETVRSELVSYPTQILSAFKRLILSGELAQNTLISLREFGEGFAAAIVIGIACGVAFALSRTIRYLFEPIFVALYTAPIIVFVPVLVVWFGIGTTSKSIAVFLSAFIPIAINTTTGIEEISESWVRALRAFGASRTQIIFKAMLPGAIPSIMAGIRLAIGRGIVVLIAGEMYVSMSGIGRLISIYSVAPDGVPEIFVLVAVVATFGYVCVLLFSLIESGLTPWRSHS